MLAITTLSPSQHSQQNFEVGPIALGSEALTSDQSMRVEDPLIAPHQCEIRWTESPEGLRVLLKNLGGTIALDSGPRIHPGVETEFSLPCTFWIGDTTIQLTDPRVAPEYDQCLTRKSPSDANEFNLAKLTQSPAPSTLGSWFDSLSQLQSSQAGSHEFFEWATRVCFSPGGLDGALVLLPSEQGWEIAASHICFPEHGIGFREDLLNAAVESNSIVFHDSQKMDSLKCELDGHSAIVCPIMGTEGECVAALYGFRSLNRRNNRLGIRPLEACFVELVAQSIATGMARLESDAKAARVKVLLEQAFSPQVAQKLQQNPRILEGQTRQVTVMFCDLRDFTRISDRIGVKVTYEFLADVMDCFTEIISQHDGVVIDFYGDGLSAFWNAPIAVANHAELAARCALEIREAVREIETKWQPRLLSRVQVGIGIHTGEAQVGNSGSRTRLKYGPRGTTVNIASRLECATKLSGAQILVSPATLAELPQSFATRRICQAQLPGMTNSMHLHELLKASSDPLTTQWIQDYHAALEHFEQQQFHDCLTMVSEILLNCDEDKVSEFLFTQCQDLLGNCNPENQESTKANLYPQFNSAEESASDEPRERKKPKEKIPEE